MNLRRFLPEISHQIVNQHRSNALLSGPAGEEQDALDAMPRTPSAGQEDLHLEHSGPSHYAPLQPYFRTYSPSQLRQRFIQIQVIDQRFKEPSWMHPNIGGEAQHVRIQDEELEHLRQLQEQAPRHLLSQWLATAISGNDILSSVLFTAGLTIAKAGPWAPLAHVLVAVVVYALRGVLQEVMGAVPLNGGCYNAMLNASSKHWAALAAILSILSYLATGVVCGISAFNYVNYVLHVPVVLCTIGMLLLFAVLCLFGIAESALVALLFFVFHVLTLSLLAATSLVYAVQHSSVLWSNLQAELPPLALLGHEMTNSVFLALAVGYGTALLSVTGFESSAQFIEEQAPGVFPKTLRNMWAFSSVFNIVFSCLALAVVPMKHILSKKEVLLAEMGRLTGGSWLELLVIVDAFVVLAGAVLTSYVGIMGLVQRLAVDRVLPAFLMRQNEWRQTNHWIILAYFAVASSLVAILGANTEALAGVFNFAFLGVMVAYTAACAMLKIQRDALPRAYVTTWSTVLFCLAMLVLGIFVTALAEPESLRYFLMYSGIVGTVVLVMLERIRALRALLYVSKQLKLFLMARRAQRHGTEFRVPPSHQFVGSTVVAKSIERIKQTPVILFCKSRNLPKINEAINYVLRNEQTYSLRLVHVSSLASGGPEDGADEGEDEHLRRHIPEADSTCFAPRFSPDVIHEFEDVVCLFDHIYPSIKIDFVSIEGAAFEPAVIEWISATMEIPKSMMLMSQPKHPATAVIAAMGVRVVTA